MGPDETPAILVTEPQRRRRLGSEGGRGGRRAYSVCASASCACGRRARAEHCARGAGFFSFVKSVQKVININFFYSLPGRRPGSASSFHQETLDSFAPPDSRATEKLHIAVTHYIVSCHRPLNTVEKESFKDMLQAFKPGYKLLSRRTLTGTYIPKVVDQVRSLLFTIMFSAVQFPCLQF